MIDWPGWIMAVAAVAAIGGGLYAWFAKQLSDEADERLELERDLAAYKLFVAQNHVTVPSLRETEERLITAIDRLTARMETIVARLDKLNASPALRD